MREVHIVCFGEILWDNLRSGRRLGGAPLNVCYHLNKMGVKSTIVSQVGADKNGLDILAELGKLGIADTFCKVIKSKPTSTVEVSLDKDKGVHYSILEEVAWDYIESDAEIEALVAGASALVFGSLIARSALSRDTLFRLIEQSRFRVLDANLRDPFYSPSLIRSLLEQVHLLKINEEELKVLSGWFGIPAQEVTDMAAQLRSRFPHIEEVIVTRGHLGAVYLSDTGILKVEAYPVEINDTVGSGDAFLAGFLAGKFQGDAIEVALDRASRLSGFVASQTGACPPYEPDALNHSAKKETTLIKNRNHDK